MPPPQRGPVRYVSAWCQYCLAHCWVAMRSLPLNLDVQCPGCLRWLKSTGVQPTRPPSSRCAWSYRVRRL